MPIAKDLLRIIACPKCRRNLYEKKMFLICSHCNMAYPVLYGDVPDLLIEDAWSIEDANKTKFKHKIKR